MPITKASMEIWRLLDANDVPGIQKAFAAHPEEINAFSGIAGGTLLHEAATRSNAAVVRALVDLGFDVNLPGCQEGDLPICRAASTARVENVRALIELGSHLDVNEPVRNPLYGAIIAGRGHSEEQVMIQAPEVAEILLRAGLDYRREYEVGSRKRPKKEGAKDKAKLWGALEIRDLILAWEEAEETGREPVIPLKAAFYKAVSNQDCSEVARLITLSPKTFERADAPNQMQTAFGSWLHCAAVNGSREIAELLVSSGQDIEARPRGWAPICTAARNANVPVVKFLIEQGAKLDEPFDGNPLRFAINSGSTEVVEMLLDAGCPHFKSDTGKGPEEWARFNWPEITKLLAMRRRAAAAASRPNPEPTSPSPFKRKSLWSRLGSAFSRR